jgi:hypothetical protein
MKGSFPMPSNRRTLLGLALGVLIAGTAPLRADFVPLKPEVDLKALRLPEGVEELNKAIESFQNGDYEQALKLLRAAEKKRTTWFHRV